MNRVIYDESLFTFKSAFEDETDLRQYNNPK